MGEPLPLVLLVDDEKHALESMRMALEDDFDCLAAPNAEGAMSLMRDNPVQVIFCDHRMPGKNGVSFLTEVREQWPDTVRIIITGYTETSDMIDAINDAGIYQLITKPWHPDHLVMAAKNATDLFRLNRENEQLSLEMRYLSRSVENKLSEQRKILREGLGFENVLRSTNSPLNPVISQARQFAGFDIPVLITGENATGKADIARAMHYRSLRADRPFYVLDCIGIDDTIIEEELFGVRGSAGGQIARTGLLQKASRGTLFIDNLSELSPRLQLMLSRALQEGKYRRVGNHSPQHIDVRIIAGTEKDLRQCVTDGSFRNDLFYAVSAAELTVLPLRDRIEDIPILADAILAEAANTHGKIVRGLSDEVLSFFARYDWPGNLKELENELVRMLVLAQGPILGPELISRHILQAEPAARKTDGNLDRLLMAEGALKERIEAVETRILRETLTRLKWNKSRAACELGLSRVGLRAKIDRYGLAEPDTTSRSEED
ncbi:sigma-54 dependent transcriptional regulator [Notoacmeibacter sp. MSK16QG-6]|uniref:sigma-54-dependent transcriptional regulator n=1 Tax=Notoacmeibacter sp. MSK16QG-6 TaxID=2957982 RepID=UPI0020A1DBC6|nr:sigma-54 dependent transcriptional regulator [Notoacmeibacter sp. MSK16QG-6]MCP1198362.1 sigma-54 dependent transcriptional regulator [Notoacmeibacter sp. MSK16QG-6]